MLLMLFMPMREASWDYVAQWMMAVVDVMTCSQWGKALELAAMSTHVLPFHWDPLLLVVKCFTQLLPEWDDQSSAEGALTRMSQGKATCSPRKM
jgi:hypothetical protein